MTTEQPKLAQGESILKRWPLLLPSVAILLLSLLIYIPIYSAPPHWDDGAYLLDNFHLRTWHGLSVIWLKPQYNWQYYPVVFTSFWIEYHLWGYTLWMYHLANVVFHAANAILLLIILRRLKVPAAFLIAVVFACHPIHVETIVYIAERKNIYSCFFFMLAMLAYWRFADGPEKKKWLAYAAALFCFILAILSKTVVAVFPVVMLMALFYQRKKICWRDALPLIPFVLVAIPQSYIVRYIEQNHVGAWGDEFHYTPIERILIAGRCLWFYAGKILFPHPLMPIYPRWMIDQSVAWQYLFPLAYAVLTGGLFWWRKKISQGPWLLALAFFVILGPALGFVSYYPMIFSYVSDHFVYLGSIPAIMGFILLARWIFERVSKSSQASAQIATTITLLILAGLNVAHGMLWQSERIIWNHNYDYNHDSAAVQANLGIFMDREGETEAAKLLLEKASGDPQVQVTAWSHLSAIATREGRHVDAVNYLRKAAARDPRGLAFWMSYGNKLQAIGEFAQAMSAYGHAARLMPSSPEPYAFTSECWWYLGDRDKAIIAAKMALELDPGNERAKKALNMAQTAPPPTSAPAATAPAKPQQSAPAKTPARKNAK